MVPLAIAAAVLVGAGVVIGAGVQRATPAPDHVTVRVIDDGAMVGRRCCRPRSYRCADNPAAGVP